MTKFFCCVAAVMFAGAAMAQDKPDTTPAGMPDMTKMGPMSRPVTKQDKKGVDAAFKAMDAAWKNGDADAAAETIDFPIIMLSDNSKGEVKHFTATREQWVAMMKPFMANMPKDMKMSHRHTAHFLSDTLAVAITEDRMTRGKIKGKWKGMAVLTKVNDAWKFKQMAEAGWGDMPPAPGAKAEAAGRAPTTTATRP